MTTAPLRRSLLMSTAAKPTASALVSGDDL